MGSDKEVSSQLFFSQSSPSVMSDSLWPHESQHARPPCPSPTPRVYSNSCPLSQWCHPAISFSVVPFSSCPQFLPASGSFPMSQLFASGGQSIGVSASTSVLPINSQDWYHKIPDRVLAHFLGPRFRPGVCWYTPPFHQHPRPRQWWSRLVALSFTGYMSRNWKGAYLPIWDVQAAETMYFPSSPPHEGPSAGTEHESQWYPVYEVTSSEN